MHDIGKLLKKRREFMKMSIEDVSLKSGEPVSEIKSYENSKEKPPAVALTKILDALETDPIDFMLH